MAKKSKNAAAAAAEPPAKKSKNAPTAAAVGGGVDAYRGAFQCPRDPSSPNMVAMVWKEALY